jgi:hypothetical protein
VSSRWNTLLKHLKTLNSLRPSFSANTVEESDAKALFQGPDLRCDRRLREMKFVRGPAIIQIVGTTRKTFNLKFSIMELLLSDNSE